MPVAASSDLPPLPASPPGRYRHCTGGAYAVIGVACHSETHAPLVLCRPLYGAGDGWLRLHAMFVERVQVDGVQEPRFEKLG